MTDRRIALALFVLALVPYVYFYGGWGANQEANYALTRAMVEGHTVTLDRFTAPKGDLSSGVGGHFYSNKPPGLSVLAAIPYTAHFAMGATSRRMLTVEVCGISGALIAPVLFLYGRRRLRVSRRSAAIVAISVAFGTIIFAYSTMLFAHVPGALFLLLAVVLLDEHPLLAGGAAGIAGACFLLSAIAAIILAAMAWTISKRHALLFVAGGAPFAVALAIYQKACFGSPFTTPLERSGDYTDRRLLLGVFAAPRSSALFGITFSEYRGLFFASPVLLFAISGAVAMHRSRRLRPLLWAVVAITALFLVGVSSFNGWHGGWAFGPRYLLPVIPLLAIPMMFAAERAGWVWLLLGGFSMAVNLTATAVDPMPPDWFYRPVSGYLFHTLLTQRVPPETRAVLYPRCPGFRCVAKKVSLAEGARNLGEPLFGTGRASSVLPPLVWIIAGSWLLLARITHEHERPPRRVRAFPPRAGALRLLLRRLGGESGSELRADARHRRGARASHR